MAVDEVVEQLLSPCYQLSDILLNNYNKYLLVIIRVIYFLITCLRR